MKRFLLILFIPIVVFGQGAPVKYNTKTHAVEKPPTSAGATYDLDFTGLSLGGITGGSGAPTTATYITQTPNASLSAEQALSALTTGLLKNTTGTGVLSIAVAGTDYLTGNQTITLSGDVGGSGTTAITATIANDAVTLAKMANMATDSIIGRATTGTGDPEVLTALPFAYTGDVTRPADSNVTTLAAGNAGNLNSGTLLAARMPALTGDVTTTVGTVATTIANDAVTYAKMQNVSAVSKLLGRGSLVGAGDPEEITLGSGLTMTGTTLSVSAGGGNVSNVGTPTDGQIAQWDTASTIRGVTPTSPIVSDGSANTITLDTSVDFNFQNAQTVTVNNSDTNTIWDVLLVDKNTTGTPANGIGPGIAFMGETSTTPDTLQGELGTGWSDVTHASRSAYMDFKLVNNAAASASKMRLFPSGGLSVNSTTDPGAGYINANTGFKIAGNLIDWVDVGIPDGATSGDLLIWDGAGWTPQPMSGDATIPANGTLTIANDAVTYAKMQNVSAASKLLGRGSAAGAGDVQEITLGTNLSMSGTTLNATGGAGSQTPWTSDIDADGFNLLFDDATGIKSSEAGNPELLLFTSVASAVNELGITNAATGSSPSISATGGDSDISILLTPKGTGGRVVIPTDSGYLIGTNASIYTIGVGSGLVFNLGGTAMMLQATQARIPANGLFGWTTTSGDPTAALDTALARNAAGVVEINNGTAGQWAALKGGLRDATTNAVGVSETWSHNTTGTPANGLGIETLYQLESSTTEDTDAAAIDVSWTDVTHATRKAKFVFKLASSGSPASKLELYDTGGACLNCTSDPGAGILNVNTGFNQAAAEFPIASNGIPKRTAARTWSAVTAPSGAIVGDTDTQTLTNKTVGAGALTLAENASVALDEALTDGNYTGITIPGVAGYTQASTAFGDLVQLDQTSGRWELVDANSAAAAVGDARTMLGIMLTASTTDGSACTILLQGTVRANTKFPTFTTGAPVYASETAGTVTNTQPTTTDVVIRVIGYGLANTDTLYFFPSGTWTTHT